MEKKTDEYYIREILKGDTGSFSYLVEKYSHLAFSLSLKVLGQREDAEEAAQDSFIKAYNSLVSFSGTSTFKTWFFRIVYNTAISKRRSRKSNEIHFDDVKISDREVAETENALGQLGREERIRFLNQGMKLLDSEEQALLHMYYFDDFSVDDISIITGLGASNVKVKLFRTRKKLFECLHAILKDEVISIL